MCLKVGGDRTHEEALKLEKSQDLVLVPFIPFLGLSFQGVHECLICIIKK